MVGKRFKKGVALLGGAMMLFNLALPGITMAEGETQTPAQHIVTFNKTPSDLTLEVIKGDVPAECKDLDMIFAYLLGTDTCSEECKAVYGGVELISPQEDGKYNLEAGTYSYTATKDGYTPKFFEKFEVTSEADSHTVEVTLDPLPKYEVNFTKTPSDLTLVVNEHLTPDECIDLDVFLACVLEQDGCPDVCKEVHIGNPISPEEDGKYKLEAGTYSYTATKDGYTPKENILFKVTSEGASHNVEVTLEVISQNFYTSNDNSFPVVLSGTEILLEETKEVLSKIPAPGEEIQAFLTLTSVDGAAEVKEVAGEKLLFVNINKINSSVHQTKVFREKTDGIFGPGVFKNEGATEYSSGAISFDLSKAIAPSWVDKTKEIKSYHTISKDGKEIGYTIHTKEQFGRFYVPKNYVITFDTNEGSAIAPITFGALTAITAPADPTRAGYNFAGWCSDELLTKVFNFSTPLAADTTLYAKWNKKTSNSGGGGGGGSSVTTPKPEVTTPDQPKTEESSVPTETAEKKLAELIEEFSEEYKENTQKIEALAHALASVQTSNSSQELKNAYTYAFIRGITTQETIQKADLNRGLTRAEMAKMMSVYATKVLGKKAVKADLPSYADTQEIKGDLADYIQLAYQLGIMGIDAKGNAIANFNPYAEVTRSEFGTVLSRVLFGDKFNQEGEKFFEKHLEALKAADIMKNITPTNKELRGRVMLMLQRAEGVK